MPRTPKLRPFPESLRDTMITKQIYQWKLVPAAGLFNATTFPSPGEEFSIFTGGYGTNITNQPEVLEDHFIVIENFGSTAGVVSDIYLDGTTIKNWTPNGFMQLYIDTTAYYQNPEDIKSRGISGDAAPYYKDLTSEGGYLLEPNVYVRPFQTWDFRYSMCNEIDALIGNSWDGELTVTKALIQYWLFTGSDALICEKLLQLGINVTVDNVEWFRRKLLISRGLDTSTWEWYLQVSQEYWEQEKSRERQPDTKDIFKKVTF